MRHYLFFILVLMLSFCYGQNNTEFEFIGTLQISDGVVITYKISFKSDSLGKIEGVSVTDFFGENNTKSKISGIFNAKEHRISFNETENMSTKSNANPNEFCFIRVKNAKWNSIKGKNIIQGNFKGFFGNDSSCVNGYLYLLGTDYIKELGDEFLNSKFLKNDSSLNTVRKKGADLLKKTSENNLHANDVLKIDWTSDEIILEISDNEVADQDMVTIIINEKKILENFVIKREKKIIVFPFEKDTCTIKIIANNEGLSPPNTVNATLKDGAAYTLFNSSLKKGEAASLLLHKKIDY